MSELIYYAITMILGTIIGYKITDVLLNVYKGKSNKNARFISKRGLI